MKFLLLLSFIVVFVATGTVGIKCKCCNRQECLESACDDNGESLTTRDCGSYYDIVTKQTNNYDACFTRKQGLKICFNDVAAAASLTEHHK